MNFAMVCVFFIMASTLLKQDLQAMVNSLWNTTICNCYEQTWNDLHLHSGLRSPPSASQLTVVLTYLDPLHFGHLRRKWKERAASFDVNYL